MLNFGLKAMYHSIYKSSLFDHKVVIITGGGSGIGRCTAHELATLGAQVIIIGRNIDKLKIVADEINKDGHHCDFYSLDIRDSESIRNVLKSIIKKYGQIDGLVNNAGGQLPSSLENISDNAVAPGSVASSGIETYPEKFKKKLKQRKHQVPMKRQATEAEISSAIVYLLSDGAAYVTGHTMEVDGGLPLAKEKWSVPEHNICKPYNGFHLYKAPQLLRH